MPAALERKLKRQVAGKKMSEERKDAYVYGTLRKTGWKPKREKKLGALLDNLIQFAELPAVGSSLERLKGIVSQAAPKLQTSARFLPETEAVAMKQAHNRVATMNPYWKRTTAMYPGNSPRGLDTNPLFQGSNRGWLANKRPIGTLPNTSTQSLFRNREKPIQFGAEILGPWQGSKKPESKIEQELFPAGPSPLALLKMPFPQLMAYMNKRNHLQTAYSEKIDRLVQLNEKLDEIQLAVHPNLKTVHRAWHGAKPMILAGAKIGAIGAGAGVAGIGAYKLGERHQQTKEWRRTAGARIRL